MLPLGHSAFSLLALRLVRPTARPSEHVAVVLGALTPDLIDKPLALLGLAETTRTVGHSVTFAVAAAALAWALVRLLPSRRAVARAFVGGLLGHALCDLTADLEAGLLYTGRLFGRWMMWPFQDRVDGLIEIVPPMIQREFVTAQEVVLVLLAMLVFGQRARAASSRAQHATGESAERID
jgi:hypothetical protein